MMRHTKDGCGHLVDVVPDFCPLCGRAGDEWEEVHADEPEESHAVGTPPATLLQRPAEPRAADDRETWTCARCERVNAASLVVCIECGARAGGHVRCVISGDAGIHSLVPGGQLVVGRSSHSPSASSLASFDNVSWVQLLVTFDAEGRVMVTDLDSTNGTWAVRGDQRRQLRPLACTSLDVG